MRPYKGKCLITCMKNKCAHGKQKIDFACLNCKNRSLEILNLQDDVLISLDPQKQERPEKRKIKKEK